MVHTAENESNDSASTIIKDDASSPFHQLVPDCRKLILSFHWHQISIEEIPHRGAFSSAEPTPDLRFSLQYFRCEVSLKSLSQLDFPLLSNLSSLHLQVKSVDTFTNFPRPFSHFNNLVELNIYDNGAFTDEMFQDLGSLEALTVEGVVDEGQPYTDSILFYLKNYSNSKTRPRQSLTDDIFKNLKHLKHLEIDFCRNFTDKAFENLHAAGSTLEKLEVHGCNGITDRAFSFINGDSLRELTMNHCSNFCGEGLSHLNGLEQMTLVGLNRMNCHEAFKCLEDSVQFLNVSHSSITSFDEKSISYLKGISTLLLCRVKIENHTDPSTFSHLSGSIKRLEIRLSKGSERLSKDILWHLAGIKKVLLCDTGIRIEAEDLPRLQQVFKSVSSCEVSLDFADGATMKQLCEFIEGNGGRFVC